MVAIIERHKTRSRGWEMALQAVARKPVTPCRFDQLSRHRAARSILSEVTISPKPTRYQDKSRDFSADSGRAEWPG